MPSSINPNGAVGVARLASLARTGIPASTLVRTVGPWGGAVSGIARQLLDQRSFHFDGTSNIIGVGERLTYDYGWIRFQGDDPGVGQLPLGGVGQSFAPDQGRPVLEINQLVRLPGQSELILAVTAKRTNDTVPGTLFVFGVGGKQWSEVLAAPGTATIDVDADASAFLSTIYPLAVPFFGHRGIMVWTTGLGGNARVYYYPAGNTSTYAELPVPSADPFNFSPFRARSLCVHRERLHFFNTVEGETSFPQRFRWTIPSWTAVSADNLGAPDQVGSGALDITDFSGAGVTCLPIGNKIALYFEDGVAFIESTGNATAPYRKEIITKTRGLLGPKAIVDVGGGIHFGIFTDGWFLLTENGEWRELGLTDAAGVSTRKFSDDFYRFLKPDSFDQISTGYDPIRRFVYVSWIDSRELPSNQPNTVWLYDVRGDRVWPLNYTTNAPTCWAYVRPVIEPEETWDSGVGSWDEDDEAWNTQPQQAGRLFLVHGTRGGMVWQHDPSIHTRDGQLVNWSIKTETDFGSPFHDKTFLRRSLLLEEGSGSLLFSVTDPRNTGGSLPDVAIFRINEPISNGVIQVVRSDVHRTAPRFAIFMSGGHPVTILSWEDEVVGTTGESQQKGL